MADDQGRLLALYGKALSGRIQDAGCRTTLNPDSS